MTLLDHKDLFIRLLVQPGATARGSLHPEKRNGNASMFPSLKEIGGSATELLSGNDLCHVFSPFSCSEVRDGGNDLATDGLFRIKLPSALFAGQSRNHRGKVLYLSCRDLQIGETIALAQLKKMRNRLLGSERSAWNEPPSWLGRASSSTVGDFQVEDRLTQFQICEAVVGSLFDPGDFLLQGGVCRIHTLRGYLRPNGDDISFSGCQL